MRRCLELAALGAGYTAPNPMVGAVLVYKNRIIGEGYHRQFGQPHAEVNALAAVKEQNKALIPHATLYVSLEPCSHYGKTPPCANLIIQNRIKRVVVAMSDPHPLVSGRGINLLRQNHIEVVTGILQQEAQWLNRRFVWFHTRSRPWLLLKWAQTQDSYFALQSNLQIWISNTFVKMLIHRRRSMEQSIMTGTNTALTDNPQLNVRDWFGPSPVRLVLDRNLRLPKHLHLFNNSAPCIIFTQQPAPQTNLGNLKYVQLEFGKNLLPEILGYLHEQQIQSVMVEGGKQLLQSFIDENLWNEALVITGNQYWGKGIKAPCLPPEAKLLRSALLYNNQVQEWVNEVHNFGEPFLTTTVV
ncbi:bifunctional diaminohydroxyphosphoribosylaminopyrimidine deaminase/5-amino-6-(5-phosphoribosylamino)uracil reductase RibD [Sphingobacteriales bacterium UPWRP_1]|nr:bifunctional diaminohydroxyphosphoribosylaminopyrimidine deaminase/5-amino-6-(5-phosphoribosylamino)uracil reductase RibD [Sphingobacteriales bacterium UPWRP_1]